MTLPELKIGVTSETECLDFKAIFWRPERSSTKNWQHELAKDIAAMANSNGGHLIVGAAEKDEILTKFIDPKLPQKWEPQLRQTVATWLFPEPSITALLHDFTDSGTKQLIVAISPSIQRVLIQDPKDSQRNLCLPIRRGTQTVYANPYEVVVMLNNPYRALEIKLNEIAALARSDEKVNIEIITSRQSSSQQNQLVHGYKWHIQEVHTEYVLLSSVDEKIVFPYYYIRAIYPIEGRRRYWRIVYDGQLTPSRREPGYREIVPRPFNT